MSRYEKREQGKIFSALLLTSKTGDPENLKIYFIMNLQLIEGESRELRIKMANYKLYGVYYRHFIIHLDMLMSKHGLLVFLDREDQ